MFHVPNKFRLRKHVFLGSDESYGNNGFFVFPYKGYEIRVMASDEYGWEHCSVTINRKQTPSWDMMCFVKNMFWDEEDAVFQIHPPKSKYVNEHEYCLHLWRSTEKDFPIPDPLLIGRKLKTDG